MLYCRSNFDQGWLFWFDIGPETLINIRYRVDCVGQFSNINSSLVTLCCPPSLDTHIILSSPSRFENGVSQLTEQRRPCDCCCYLANSPYILYCSATFNHSYSAPSHYDVSEAIPSNPYQSQRYQEEKCKQDSIAQFGLCNLVYLGQLEVRNLRQRTYSQRWHPIPPPHPQIPPDNIQC